MRRSPAVLSLVFASPRSVSLALMGVALVAQMTVPTGAVTSVKVALTGQVTSTEEGPMEGVLVSARRAGSSIRLTVVSDAKGVYRFRSDRLAAGRYAIGIRAVGYELDGPIDVDVDSDKIATADIELRKTKNLASQLTDAEWLASIPGTDDQKKQLLGCTNCHTLERTLKSKHDAQQFMDVLERMASYANQSFPLHPQRRVSAPNLVRRFGAGTDDLARYLATVNLSTATAWPYPLKTLPRPTGAATDVIITEYDLPRKTIEPHDVIVDTDGVVWFSNFGEQFLGRLDPKTGKVTEYPVPLIRPGFPTGMLDLERDLDGIFRLSLMYLGGMARFYRKTVE